MVLPCILSPLCSLLSLSRPSKSPHDRCWPLKARPRHRHWLIIDLVLGKIGEEEPGEDSEESTARQGFTRALEHWNKLEY